jgi:hypothetical protein
VASFGALLVVLLALVTWTLIESPKYPQKVHFGDDSEYLLTTESFIRHHSPDYRREDALQVLESLPRLWRWSMTRKYGQDAKSVPLGYFPARDGRYFSWHFWSYAAVVAPIKAFLYTRDRGVQAFGYANCLLFCAGMLSMLQLWSMPRIWPVLVPLAFFCPVLWFLPLAHTEPFVFALGLAAAASFLRRRYRTALLLNSLAATQFQPLALVSAFICFEALASRLHWRSPWTTFRVSWAYCVSCVACFAITLLPTAFYQYHYGVSSLIAREGFAASHLMSMDKFLSMFIDLNYGMLTYMPGLLLLLAWALALALWRAVAQRRLRHLLPWLATLAALWSATSALGWNFQTQGVSRYALYAAPPMLLLVASELRARPSLSTSTLACVVVAFGLQAWVHATFGWFEYRGDRNSQHNIVAEYVLQHWPRFYNPPPEIFCARTLRARCYVDLVTGLVREEHLPVVFINDAGKPTKALAVSCDPERLLAAANWTTDQQAAIRRQLSVCVGRVPVYVNF